MSQQTNGSPWSHVDATHLTGDLYFVDKFASKWWTATGIMCFLVPPGGLVALAYMVSCCIQRAGEDVSVRFD